MARRKSRVGELWIRLNDPASKNKAKMIAGHSHHHPPQVCPHLCSCICIHMCTHTCTPVGMPYIYLSFGYVISTHSEKVHAWLLRDAYKALDYLLRVKEITRSPATPQRGDEGMLIFHFSSRECERDETRRECQVCLPPSTAASHTSHKCGRMWALQLTSNTASHE